jgi:hypothetical protein
VTPVWATLDCGSLLPPESHGHRNILMRLCFSVSGRQSEKDVISIGKRMGAKEYCHSLAPILLPISGSSVLNRGQDV